MCIHVSWIAMADAMSGTPLKYSLVMWSYCPLYNVPYSKTATNTMNRPDVERKYTI